VLTICPCASTWRLGWGIVSRAVARRFSVSVSSARSTPGDVSFSERLMAAAGTRACSTSTPSRRAVSRRTAASPPLRTISTMSATEPLTRSRSSSVGRSARTVSATEAAVI